MLLLLNSIFQKQDFHSLIIFLHSSHTFAVLFFLGAGITLFDLAGALAWGLMANILYNVGYVLDSYLISHSKGKRSLEEKRIFWFCLGTIGYAIASFLFMFLYTIPLD